MATVVNDRDVLIMATTPRYTVANNRGMFVTPPAAIFKLASTGTSASPASFLFQATLLNITGTVTWSWTDGMTPTVNGNELTLTYANFSAVSGTITATITVDGEVYTKIATVTKLADGATSYTWIKYADTAAGAGLSDDPSGKAYIGLAYNKTTATESTTASDYTWSLIKGADGVAGAKGADGSTLYTWIKYSDAADGTGLYDTPTASTLYIGIAVNKTTATESTTKTDYVWSKFRGSDGVPGTTGPQGIRGNVDISAVTTSSVWVDAEAVAALAAAGYGAPQVRDLVNLYKADRTFGVQKMYSGSAWIAVDYVWNGNVFVKGSILPEAIDTRGLTIRDAAGNVILGSGTGLSTTYAAAGTLNSELTPAINAAATSVFAAYKTWEFESSTEGWFGVTGANITSASGVMHVTSTSGDPILESPSLSFPGGIYDKVRARIRRTAGSAWDGALYFNQEGTDGSGYNAGTALALNTWAVLEWDMSSVPGWTSQTINHIRIDLGASAADVFDVDWISIGKYGPAPSVTTVAAAQAAADAANTAITAISSDNVLSKGEKLQTIQAWQVIDAEKSGIDSQADALAVSRVAYDNAYSALSSHLLGLGQSGAYPAWDDTGGDTPINGVTFRTTWATYYTAKQGLLNAIAAKIQSNAAGAQTTANAAKAITDAMANDGILDRNEKAQLVTEWVTIDADWTYTRNKAIDLGMDVSYYDTCHTNTSNYLLSMVPGWADVSQDTVIDRAAFRESFRLLYEAKAILQNAIAAKAATMASGIAVGKNKLANSAPASKSGYVVSNPSAIALDGGTVLYSDNSDWGPSRKCVFLHAFGAPSAGAVIDLYSEANGYIPVIAGQRYEASVGISAHRCRTQVRVGWYDANKNFVTWDGGNEVVDNGARYDWNPYPRSQMLVTAPAGAFYARVTSTMILTGQADPYMFAGQYYFGDATANQTVFSNWTEGAPLDSRAIGYAGDLNATYGATIGANLSGQMTAANISTYIAAAAIDLALINKASIGNLSALSAVIGLLRNATSGQHYELGDQGYQWFNSANVPVIQVGNF
jgi:hypothetical protein